MSAFIPAFASAQAGLRMANVAGERRGTNVQNSEKIWQLVDARKEDYEALSDRVWGMPELCYGEYRSVTEHKAMLEREGFRIAENVTAFGHAGGRGIFCTINCRQRLPAQNHRHRVVLHGHDRFPCLDNFISIAWPHHDHVRHGAQ